MRLAKGATKQQAVEDVCRVFFVPQSLKSVPTILEWWDEETRRTVTHLGGWKAGKALGLR